MGVQESGVNNDVSHPQLSAKYFARCNWTSVHQEKIELKLVTVIGLNSAIFL